MWNLNKQICWRWGGEGQESGPKILPKRNSDLNKTGLTHKIKESLIFPVQLTNY